MVEEDKDKKGFRTWVGISIFLMIVGAVILVYTINLSYQSNSSTNWPTTQGTILSSEVESHTTKKYDKNGHASTSTDYRAKILYQYAINGTYYSSDEISLMYSSFWGDINEAQQLVEKYPAGKNVTIHYNPESPSEAVLEPGTAPSSMMNFMTCGATLIPLGIIFLLLALRKRKKSMPSEKSDSSPENNT